MTFDVAVLGSANLDLILSVAVLPGAGETVLASGHERHPGGKGLNQAVASARAGAVTAMVGTVGQDDAGRELLATMEEAGVDTCAVAGVGVPSGTALIVVQATGENTIVVDAGANATMTALSAEGRSVIERSSVLLMQLEVALSAVTEAAELARSAGITVLLNASPVQPLDESLLSLIDVLVVNEHEAVALAGVADPAEAAMELTHRVADVIVTLGARGAVHVTRDGRPTRTAGVRADPVDTTGAGDTFVGFLAAALAGGDPMPLAVARAVTAGALCVEAAGAVPSIPTRMSVEARLQKTSAAAG